MGRLWQTLILSQWHSIFANIPVESSINQHQKAYYTAPQASTDQADAAPFITFILQMIMDAIQSSTTIDRGSVQIQENVSDQVMQLILLMDQREYRLTELMALLGLVHRASFQKNYLNPALEAGLIQRTIPDKPKSPLQRYRLGKL